MEAPPLNCHRCGYTMEHGALLAAPPSETRPAGSGVRWSTRETGGTPGELAVIAYRCTKCGYIEFFAPPPPRRK